MYTSLNTRQTFRLVILAALMLFSADLQAQRTGGGGGGGGRTGGGGGGTGGGGGAARSSSGSSSYPRSTDIGDAMISVDPETRQVVVIADDETLAQIRQVIANLDKPKPQVLLRVMFLQVTRGKDLDLGVEGSYTHQPSSTITGTASSGFGIQDAASVAAGGGLYKIVGNDFAAAIRALAVTGKTEILSQPSILARNNQQATIVVGQQVPFITNTRFDAVNGQINTVTYSDIGIILRVTPFINSEGMVEMILAPEISSVSDKTVNISQGVNAAVIDKRSADTVVVTPDKQTVAIGGLIGTQVNHQDRKIPLLGDIPYLGALFKRTVNSDTKTELIIFITPTVIMKPSDLVEATAVEYDKLKDTKKAFPEQELNRILSTERAPAPPTVKPKKVK
ncbi:MAG: gspD 1 [Verrucomicrobiales bacterium]|nr:gspD 1 [Verrucomicrobiales bacterium]